MAVIFCVLLCVTIPLVLLLTRTRPHQKRTEERMEALVALRDSTPDQEQVDLGLKKQSDEGLSDRLTERIRNYAVAQKLEMKLLHAGWDISLGRFLLIIALSALAFAILAGFLFGQLAPVAVAFLGAAAANFLILRFKCNKRLNKFNDGLADSIDMMSRALRAGHSVASAIEVVAQQSPEPIGSEFGKCAQQQRFGIPFRDVLEELSGRMPSQDLSFVVTAILVQKETGGDLTEILDRTTEVIRERVRIQGEVRTHTAQGRLTGWILSGLPVGLLAGITLTSPQYTHVLFYDPLGQKLLYAAGGLIATGSFVIRRIVDIKV